MVIQDDCEVILPVVPSVSAMLDLWSQLTHEKNSEKARSRHFLYLSITWSAFSDSHCVIMYSKYLL